MKLPTAMAAPSGLTATGPGGPDALAYFNSIASFSSNGITQQSVSGSLVGQSTDFLGTSSAIVPDPADPSNSLTVNLAITQTDRQTAADDVLC